MSFPLQLSFPAQCATERIAPRLIVEIEKLALLPKRLALCIYWVSRVTVRLNRAYIIDGWTLMLICVTYLQTMQRVPDAQHATKIHSSERLAGQAARGTYKNLQVGFIFLEDLG